MSIEESKQYIKDYEELVKNPKYTPTPAMKERYEAEKKAVGGVTPTPLESTDDGGGMYGWPYGMQGIIFAMRNDAFTVAKSWSDPVRDNPYLLVDYGEAD